MVRGKICIGFLIMATGCSAPVPGRYQLPIDQIYARLAHNDLKDFKLDRQCGLLLDITPDGMPNRSVIWRVTSSNVDIVQFAAILTPVSQTETQVDIQVLQLADDPYDGRHPAFQQPIRPAIAEAVASAIEQREFDSSRVENKDLAIIKVEDSPELKKHLPAVLDASGCLLQRSSIEAGIGHFEIGDEPGQSHDD